MTNSSFQFLELSESASQKKNEKSHPFGWLFSFLGSRDLHLPSRSKRISVTLQELRNAAFSYFFDARRQGYLSDPDRAVFSCTRHLRLNQDIPSPGSQPAHLLPPTECFAAKSVWLRSGNKMKRSVPGQACRRRQYNAYSKEAQQRRDHFVSAS